MKNHVRAGGAGMRGRKSPAARFLSAASLLVPLASPALADDVSVNWEALGKPARSDERIILRHPGEKEQLPVFRLKPPASVKDAAPTPLAKPVIIPESTAKKTPAPAQKPAEAPQVAIPEQRPAKPAPAPAETAKAEAEAPPEPPKAPEPVSAPVPEPAPARQTTAAQPAAKPEPESAAAPEAEAGEDGTFRVTLPSAAAKKAPEPAANPAEEEAAPAAKAQDASEEQKLAALTPPEPAFARVLFDEQSTAILSAARAELDAAAERLKQNNERVQLKAYGGDPGELSSEARKLSLRRALAVYNYLRDQGVLTSRMDVRAFGGTRDTGPTERVDIVVQER